jgi:hypothetical protein
MEAEEVVQTLWQRMEECLDDENSISCCRRLSHNAQMLSAYMESFGIISEANAALYSLQTANKKLGLETHDRRIDNALVFVFLKMLSTLPTRTKAYRLGIIDKDGRLIRQPKTAEEHDSISNLDLLMFKIRKWLASRIQYLSSISWLRGTSNSVRLQNYLSNAETLSRQYQVQRLNADLERLLQQG